MKRLITIILTWCCFINLSIAQTTTIAGNAVAHNQEPILFASVALFQQDSVMLSTTMTDTLGHFSLTCNCTEQQNYQLVIASVGYKTLKKTIKINDTADLLQLLLEEDVTLLKEVVIKAPTITRKPDRYIVHIENSYLSQGNNALSVLQKTPGVWVANNGTISIKGGQAVSVMINNVLQRMTPSELTTFLQSLKSEDIGSIEVIRNPSAEFDAEGTGGMINIVLKKVRKDGLNGSLNAEYQPQGKYPYTSLGGTLNYKWDKIVLQANYSNTYDKSNWWAKSLIVYPTQETYRTDLAIVELSKKNNLRLAANYAVSPKQSIGIQTMGIIGNRHTDMNNDVVYDTNSELITGATNSISKQQRQNYATTFNYHWVTDTLGSTFKVIADYTNAQATDNNYFRANYSNTNTDSIYRNNTPNTTNVYTLQIDYKWARPKGAEWKMGSKYSRIQRDNELITETYWNNLWNIDTAASNHFVYDENIAALYASFHRPLKRWDILLGLRAEHTLSKGDAIAADQQFERQYLGLFPSIAIEYKLNPDKGNTLYFNQSRRISRPAFNELNPYRLKIDNFQSVMGNPNLKPAYTTSFEVGYIHQGNYYADLYFNHIKDLDSQTAITLPNNNIAFTHDNFDGNYEWGADVGGTTQITKWWNSNNRLSVMYKKFVIDGYTNQQTNVLIQSTQAWTLGKNTNLALTAFYLSPSAGSIYQVSSVASIDLNFSQQLFHQKAKLGIGLLDIFNTMRENPVTHYNDTYINIYQKHPTRSINLSFSYNFSAGKSFNARNLEQSNKEEKQRIGN